MTKNESLVFSVPDSLESMWDEVTMAAFVRYHWRCPHIERVELINPKPYSHPLRLIVPVNVKLVLDNDSTL